MAGGVNGQMVSYRRSLDIPKATDNDNLKFLTRHCSSMELLNPKLKCFLTFQEDGSTEYFE